MWQTVFVAQLFSFFFLFSVYLRIYFGMYLVVVFRVENKMCHLQGKDQQGHCYFLS